MFFKLFFYKNVTSVFILLFFKFSHDFLNIPHISHIVFRIQFVLYLHLTNFINISVVNKSK